MKNKMRISRKRLSLILGAIQYLRTECEDPNSMFSYTAKDCDDAEDFIWSKWGHLLRD